jgi:hypothetical protein
LDGKTPRNFTNPSGGVHSKKAQKLRELELGKLFR